MAAAATLRPPLRAATTQTLIGLLAVTGMRIGEALRLDRGDLDLKHARLIVRDSKFGKSRELPLHPTTMRALRAYLRRREQLLPRSDTPALLHLADRRAAELPGCRTHVPPARRARRADAAVGDLSPTGT